MAEKTEDPGAAPDRPRLGLDVVFDSGVPVPPPGFETDRHRRVQCLAKVVKAEDECDDGRGEGPYFAVFLLLYDTTTDRPYYARGIRYAPYSEKGHPFASFFHLDEIPKG